MFSQAKEVKESGLPNRHLPLAGRQYTNPLRLCQKCLFIIAHTPLVRVVLDLSHVSDT